MLTRMSSLDTDLRDPHREYLTLLFLTTFRLRISTAEAPSTEEATGPCTVVDAVREVLLQTRSNMMKSSISVHTTYVCRGIRKRDLLLPYTRTHKQLPYKPFHLIPRHLVCFNIFNLQSALAQRSFTRFARTSPLRQAVRHGPPPTRRSRSDRCVLHTFLQWRSSSWPRYHPPPVDGSSSPEKHRGEYC
jgi:hypothetical protein